MTAFVGWLEGALDRAARLHPNPGRSAVHRLNRAEYSNAVRDPLAVDIKPGAMAAGRRFGLRLRQHRRRADALARAGGEISVGGAARQPAGRKAFAARSRARIATCRAATAATNASATTCRLCARRHRVSALFPGRWRISDSDQDAVEWRNRRARALLRASGDGEGWDCARWAASPMESAKAEPTVPVARRGPGAGGRSAADDSAGSSADGAHQALRDSRTRWRSRSSSSAAP